MRAVLARHVTTTRGLADNVCEDRLGETVKEEPRPPVSVPLFHRVEEYDPQEQRTKKWSVWTVSEDNKKNKKKT